MISTFERFEPMRYWIIALGATLALTGCASEPPVQLASAGPGPDPASSFRFAAASQTAAAVQPLVDARLAALGYRRRDPDARYVVELAATARPLAVGAFVASPDQPLERSKSKAPRSAAQCRVALRFVDTRSGAEAYRVEARQRRKKVGCTVQDQALADAALAGVPLPVSPPKSSGSAK